MGTTHARDLMAKSRLSLAYVVDPSCERAEALAAATCARAVAADEAFAAHLIGTHGGCDYQMAVIAKRQQ